MGVPGPWDLHPAGLLPLPCCILTCTRLPLYPYDGRLGERGSDARHNEQFPVNGSSPECTFTQISLLRESSKSSKMMSFGQGTAHNAWSPFVSLLIPARKNSAQKTIHKMLVKDPQYLRPESREEMNQRIESLWDSSIRKARRRGRGSPSHPQNGGVNTETLEVLTESLIYPTLASLTDVCAERLFVIQPRLPTHFRIDSR